MPNAPSKHITRSTELDAEATAARDESWKAEYDRHLSGWREESAVRREAAEKERERWEKLKQGQGNRASAFPSVLSSLSCTDINETNGHQYSECTKSYRCPWFCSRRKGRRPRHRGSQCGSIADEIDVRSLTPVIFLNGAFSRHYWRLQQTSKPLSTQVPFPVLGTSRLQARKLGNKLAQLSPRTPHYPFPIHLHTLPPSPLKRSVRRIHHRRPPFIHPQSHFQYLTRPSRVVHVFSHWSPPSLSTYFCHSLTESCSGLVRYSHDISSNGKDGTM